MHVPSHNVDSLLERPINCDNKVKGKKYSATVGKRTETDGERKKDETQIPIFFGLRDSASAAEECCCPHGDYQS